MEAPLEWSLSTKKFTEGEKLRCVFKIDRCTAVVLKHFGAAIFHLPDVGDDFQLTFSASCQYIERIFLMGSFFAIFCRRVVPDSILPVLFCKAAPHTTFSRSKKRTQIYCMVYILSTCDTLRLDASLPGTFHEDSSNIFSRLSFIISFLFFGLVFGTMREVNSLEQLVVVLEYVQLTRQSGESGLEPDVDCEDQQTT